MNTSDPAPEQELDQESVALMDEDAPAEDSQPEPDSPDDVAEAPDLTDEVEAEAPEDTDPEAPADPDATGQLEELEEADPAPPESQPSVDSPDSQRTPFQFRADGREFAPEGAYVEDDNVVIPRDVWNRQVQPLVRDQAALDRERTAYQRRVEELDPERNPDVIRAKTLVERLDELLADPEKLYAFAENLEANRDRLTLEVENKILKTQQEQATGRLTEHDQRAQREAAEPVFRSHLEQAVDAVLGEEAFKGLPFNRDKVIKALWRAGPQVFRQVGEGEHVAGPDGRPMPPGTYYVDTGFITDYLEPTADALRQATVRGRKADEAREQNDAALKRKQGSKPKPTVPAKGSPAGGSDEIDPTTAKTPEEYAEAMRKKYQIPG